MNLGDSGSGWAERRGNPRDSGKQRETRQEVGLTQREQGLLLVNMGGLESQPTGTLGKWELRKVLLDGWVGLRT